MNTFRNKQFKNELDPRYAFYDCLRSCEIKSNSEKFSEECVENLNLDHYQKISMAKNRNLNSIQYLFWRYRVFI